MSEPGTPRSQWNLSGGRRTSSDMALRPLLKEVNRSSWQWFSTSGDCVWQICILGRDFHSSCPLLWSRPHCSRLWPNGRCKEISWANLDLGLFAGFVVLHVTHNSTLFWLDLLLPTSPIQSDDSLIGNRWSQLVPLGLGGLPLDPLLNLVCSRFGTWNFKPLWNILTWCSVNERFQ